MEYRALLLVLCLIIIIVCSIFLLLWPIKIAKKDNLKQI